MAWQHSCLCAIMASPESHRPVCATCSQGTTFEYATAWCSQIGQEAHHCRACLTHRDCKCNNPAAVRSTQEAQIRWQQKIAALQAAHLSQSTAHQG